MTTRSRLLVALLAGCGSTPPNPANPDGSAMADAGGDAGEIVLASGTTKNPTQVSCPGNVPLPSGAVCTRLTVQCPGVEDLDVTVAVTSPQGGSGRTVVLHDGGGGTSFFTHAGFAQNLVGRGIRTVQLAWQTDWEVSSMANSALVAACRPATLFRWAFAQPHGGSRAAGFCALGQSGGSGAVAYALSHYGLGDTLDFAMMAAGPPFGRIDYGCAPETFNGSVTECAGEPTEIVNAPIAYGAEHSAFLDSIEGTTSCTSGSASAADIAHWAADSVDSPGARYSYPNTPTSFWYCGQMPNNTPGVGWFFNSKITTMKDVNCIPTCSVEAFYADPPTLAAMEQHVDDECQPRHR